MANHVDAGLRYSLDPLEQDAKSGKQYFAYGEFEWLRYPGKEAPDGMMIAKCTIDPGKEWPAHVHGGYEQMLHVISGRGVHWVNGEEIQLEPGSTHYLPVGTSHRMVNTGTEPLVHLSAYHPTMPREIREITDFMHELPGRKHRSAKEHAQALPIATMQAIQDKFSAAVHLGVVTIDREGRSLTSPTHLPSICRYVQSTPAGCRGCAAFDPKRGEEALANNGPIMFECCPGVICVAVPLKAEEQLIGHMACGFVKLDEPGEDQYKAISEKAASLGLSPSEIERRYRDIEVVLKAQMVAAADSLESIANAVLSFSIREARRDEEAQHQAEMLKKLQLVSRLEQELQESEFMALEARINPHFLFNALNTIAEAVAEGDERSVEIIHSLSDFLRASLRNTKSTTTLSQELKCVENYLHIQKARFGDGLQTEFHLEPMDIDPVVPSMILQPLVENSIVHGLSSLGYKGLIRIEASVAGKGKRLRLEVRDTGVGFGDVIVGLGGRGKNGGQSLGLRYVRTKLQHTFGDDCSFSIVSSPGDGAVVMMEMPLRAGVHNV
jgi:two-component system LytT family sensor kinase